MPSELFEKKLREKFAEANIPPSPELWNNIESQISGPDNNRRLGFWILLLALLFGTLGMLWGFWNTRSGDLVEQAYVAEAHTAQSFNNQEAEIHASDPAPSIIPSEVQVSSSKQQIIQNASTQPLDDPALSPSTPKDIPLKEQRKETIRSDENTRVLDAMQTGPHSLTPLQQSDHEQVPSTTTENTVEENSLTDPAAFIPVERNTIGVLATMKQRNLKLNLHSPTGFQGSMPIPRTKAKSWSLHIYGEAYESLDQLDLFSGSQDADFQALTNSGNRVENDFPSPAQQESVSFEGLSSPGYARVILPSRARRIGIQVERQISTRLSIQGGVEFGTFDGGSYQLAIFNSTGSQSPSGPVTQPSQLPISNRFTTFNYRQVGIPLQINYQFLRWGRSSLQLAAGANLQFSQAYSSSITQSANFYDFAVDQDNAFSNNSRRNAVSQDLPGVIEYNRFNLAANSGLTYHFHFSDRYSVYAGPQFRVQMTPLFKPANKAFFESPYYAGFRLGFRLSK